MKKIFLLAMAACFAFVSCDDASDEGSSSSSISASVVSTTGSTISLNVNRGDYAGNYFVGIVEASEHTGTDTELAENIIINAIADGKVSDFSAADNKYIFSAGGAITVGSGWSLKGSTTYCVAVFGVDAMGNIMTSVVVLDATTTDSAEGSTGTYTISAEIVDVISNNITVKVDKGDYTGNFYIGLTTADYYPGTPESFAEWLIEWEVYYGTDFSDADEYFVYYIGGEISLNKSWNIVGGNDYYVAVFGIDASGNVITNVVELQTSTPEVPIVGSIEATITEQSTSSIVIDMTPSDGVGCYTTTLYYTSDYEQYLYSDPEYAAQYTIYVYQYYYGITDLSTPDGEAILSGAMTYDYFDIFEGLEANVDYTSVTFGFDADGNVNTNVVILDAYAGRTSVAPKPSYVETATENRVRPLNRFEVFSSQVIRK